MVLLNFLQSGGGTTELLAAVLDAHVLDACTHTHTHTHTCTHSLIHIHTRTHAHTHAYTHACTHMHTHAYTNTHTHTPQTYCAVIKRRLH